MLNFQPHNPLFSEGRSFIVSTLNGIADFIVSLRREMQWVNVFSFFLLEKRDFIPQAPKIWQFLLPLCYLLTTGKKKPVLCKSTTAVSLSSSHWPEFYQTPFSFLRKHESEFVHLLQKHKKCEALTNVISALWGK